jgi:hypothetical protein
MRRDGRSRMRMAPDRQRRRLRRVGSRWIETAVPVPAIRASSVSVSSKHVASFGCRPSRDVCRRRYGVLQSLAADIIINSSIERELSADIWLAQWRGEWKNSRDGCANEIAVVAPTSHARDAGKGRG